MNWIDFMILGFLLISVAGGLAEGFVKMGIGFVALILGFVIASWTYGMAAGWLLTWIDSRALASILGFILIFSGINLLGALIAWLIQRFFKVIGLTWLDRVVGGAFGVVRGVLVLAVVTLVFTAFYPRKLPAAVSQSEFAPYVFRASDVLAEATPYELKAGFAKSYDELTELFKELKREKKPRSEAKN